MNLLNRTQLLGNQAEAYFVLSNCKPNKVTNRVVLNSKFCLHNYFLRSHQKICLPFQN